MITNLKTRITAFFKFINNGKLADAIMRWPRPVSFILIIVMFIVGWSDPATLLAFASAIAVLPENFWGVVMIILGSIASTKLAKDFTDILGKWKQ